MMYTELGRSWKVSDESLSNAQFRISSNPRHGEESFGDHNDIKESSQHCVFCLSKQAILRQLWILKQAVEAKNKKIIELEQFIQRLSQMVLS